MRSVLLPLLVAIGVGLLIIRVVFLFMGKPNATREVNEKEWEDSGADGL